MRARWPLLIAAGIALVPAAVAADAWDQTAMFETPGEVSTPAQSQRRMQVTPTEPAPPTTFVWAGPIPAAYIGLGCPQHEADVIAQRFLAAGASSDTVIWALKTISRESGCRYWVFNDNPRTGDKSTSLCQLNIKAGHFGPNGVLKGWDPYRMLEDFSYAVDACVKMWTVCGRGPWQQGNYYCTRPSS